MSYIDLHMHSYIAMIENSPKELVELCLENRIKYFPIADHNSVRGISTAKKY